MTALLAALLLAPPAFPAAELAPPPETPPPGAATYTNPVIAEVGPADPCVIEVDGTYYLYPTGDNRTYRAYTSRDLVHWEKGPVVFAPKTDAGERENNVWAPDVWRDPETGTFYLYYTANFRIGVATADGPLGPFEDRGTLKTPAIDAHLFRDDDGSLYLYYVRLREGGVRTPFRIFVQPMADPLTPAGEPTFCLQPTEPWERRHAPITEGPLTLKRGGVYYLVYSGSAASSLDYAVGYATANSPTGPFTKYAGNPVAARGGGVSGPGHGSIVPDAAGALWHVYHQQIDDTEQWNRDVSIDPVWFDADGTLHARVTRGTPQVAPAVAPPER